MRKSMAYIFMITLTAVLLTACGSRQNNMEADNAKNNSGVDATADVSTDTPTDTTVGTNADTPADATADNVSSSPNTDTIISEEEARGIAFKDANLTDSDISRLEIKLDRDDGIQKYEIDFHAGEQEYDYEINAASGEILEKDVEPID